MGGNPRQRPDFNLEILQYHPVQLTGKGFSGFSVGSGTKGPWPGCYTIKTVDSRAALLYLPPRRILICHTFKSSSGHVSLHDVTDATLGEHVGSSHIFSTLLPMVVAYISPVAAIDPRVSPARTTATTEDDIERRKTRDLSRVITWSLVNQGVAIQAKSCPTS